jgi:flagellar motor switch protein FliM
VSFDLQEPLLSDEETLALLAAVREAAPAVQVSTEGIDLTSQDRRMQAALTHAERVEPAFHLELKKLLRRTTGAVPTVRRTPSDVASLDEVSSTVPSGAGLAILETKEHNIALLFVSPALAMTIVERRLGAPVDGADAMPRGSLSSLDRAVLRSFVEQAARAFGMAWCGQEDAFTVRDLVGVLDPEELGSRFEPLLRTRAFVALGNSLESEVLVALTASAVRDTMPRERQGVVVVPTSEDRLRIAARLAQAEVYVIAHLGAVRSTVGAVLKLAVGDVLRLEHIPDQPIDVRVGGVTKMRGMPVVDHGNLAVRVVETTL